MCNIAARSQIDLKNQVDQGRDGGDELSQTAKILGLPTVAA